MPRTSTMRAVIFTGVGSVAVEDRPTPKIIEPTDAILKVTSTALCGSDLHFYRGHLKAPPGFICGHEFVGIVDEVGSAVKKCVVGEEYVVPFFTACGECFYCKRGQASRCKEGVLFGNSVPPGAIDGGQAEYVRCPHADSTLVKAPTDKIPRELLVLMADIFPTGYFAASRYLKGLSAQEKKETVAVVIGCGPVGICATVCALTMCDTVFAVDGVEDRLKEAEKVGAIPVKLGDDLVGKVKAKTDGRGADVVMEVVGHADAFQLALDVVRPFGKISSVGVHTEILQIAGMQLYGKNVGMEFGRCPVRSIFEPALELLVKEQDKVKFLCDRVMSMEEAPKAFEMFEQRKVHKIVFKV